MQPGATAQTEERPAIVARTRLLGRREEKGTAVLLSRHFAHLPTEDISEALTCTDGYDRLGDSQAVCDRRRRDRPVWDGRAVSVFRGSRVARSTVRGQVRPWFKLENAGQSEDMEVRRSSRHARRFSLRRELICDIKIGPSENSPASAFRVNPRKYPPADLIAAPRCRMHATTIAAGISPRTVCASSQALGLIPSIDRTTAAVASKSRQFEIPPLA